jgi:MazG family protein
MKEFNKLIKIMNQLRNPENGCPWDRKQTPDSLKEYIVEEAYELVEAIEMNSPERQQEELGDLLLQVVFLSQINAEKNNFTVADVIDTINKKLINRHPHIFGNVTVRSADEVKQNWEKIKKKEKKRESILSEYPDQMPALSTAKRLGEQASNVGFDWDDPLEALAKVEEEIEELKQELKKGETGRVFEEIGDILFAVANVARLARINPEFALRNCNKKFISRFRYIEKKLKEQGRDIDEAGFDEMEELWQQSKTI